LIKNKDSVDESTSGKTKIKWSTKRKINKKEQKKRLNTRKRSLVCPKSPLMVFYELYKDVPIKLEGRLHNNSFVVFTASLLASVQERRKKPDYICPRVKDQVCLIISVPLTFGDL
jgi:hypothetical protein